MSINKNLSLLFIVFYLIFGGALGQAFVWCAEPGDFTHLEYNLAGSCGTDCEEGAPSPTSTAPGLTGEDCEDTSSKILFTEASSPRADDAVPADGLFAAALSPWLTDIALTGPVTAYAPPPEPDRPPTIAYLSLRTTILRH